MRITATNIPYYIRERKRTALFRTKKKKTIPPTDKLKTEHPTPNAASPRLNAGETRRRNPPAKCAVPPASDRHLQHSSYRQHSPPIAEMQTDPSNVHRSPIEKSLVTTVAGNTPESDVDHPHTVPKAHTRTPRTGEKQNSPKINTRERAIAKRRYIKRLRAKVAASSPPGLFRRKTLERGKRRDSHGARTLLTRLMTNSEAS